MIVPMGADAETLPPPPAARAAAGTGLHEQVLDAVGAAIGGGELPPGSVLSMDRLAEVHGVSRTVVREVVKVLESLQMVSSRRRIGVTVRPAQDWDALNPRVIRWRLAGPGRAEQLRALSELRLGIEPAAAALAASRATPEHCGRLTEAVIAMTVSGRAGDLRSYLAHDSAFHRTVLEASGSPLLRALGGLVEEVLRARTEHRLMPRHPEPAAIRLHGDVAAAVAGGDAAAAEAAMREIVTESMAAMEAAAAADPEPDR